ncbi:uncharacterized protein LOC111627389 [Centruroides sculpturatus]|uniref:uncharacterized protein LOC111627389 n=1 Tax=Centruroides sculpturatus TaxID=218467 RepID=UPI000C6E58FC|nr:uncharacterized protein LOC111627389 [Centruroides sculpturatus]
MEKNIEDVYMLEDENRDPAFVLSEEQFDLPDLSVNFPTDYNDEDDSLSWDFESYQDINYMEIVVDLAEDYLCYSDTNLQNVDKKDAYCCCHEYENHHVSRAQKVELQAINDCHNRNSKYLCEEQLDPPDLRSTNYDDRNDDFSSWDLESYRETNYMEIVLGLSGEYFGYSNSNSQQDHKENIHFRCDEYENHRVSSAQKVEFQAVNDCLNRNYELMCEEQIHPPPLSMKLQNYNDRDDFLSWDMEGFKETDYSDIVLDLTC